MQTQKAAQLIKVIADSLEREPGQFNLNVTIVGETPLPGFEPGFPD
jgi:hypothetical protein